MALVNSLWFLWEFQFLLLIFSVLSKVQGESGRKSLNSGPFLKTFSFSQLTFSKYLNSRYYTWCWRYKGFAALEALTGQFGRNNSKTVWQAPIFSTGAQEGEISSAHQREQIQDGGGATPWLKWGTQPSDFFREEIIASSWATQKGRGSPWVCRFVES